MQLQNFDDAQIARHYESEYLNLTSDEKNAERTKLVKQWVPKHARILDVGGGTNPSQPNYPFNEYHIVDRTPNSSGLANYHQCTLGELDAALGSFDVVFAYHVLEHLESPAEDLRSLGRVMRQDSVVIVEVPNLPRILLELPYYAFFFQHISMFDSSSLDALMAESGFTRLAIVRKDFVLLQVYQLAGQDPGSLVQPVPSPQVGRFRLLGYPAMMRELDAFLCSQIDSSKRTLTMLGAGGSTSLLMYHCREFSEAVQVVFDSDERKWSKFIPGTGIRVTRMPPAVSSACLVSHDLRQFNALQMSDVSVIDLRSTLHALPRLSAENFG